MNIALVDDEIEYHKIVRNYIREIEDYNIYLDCFIDVDDLEKSNVVYDIVLLDICLKNINGIQYSKCHPQYNIIFITNYDSYMQGSFGPNIYGFIKKSDSKEYFHSCIRNVYSRLLEQKSIVIKTRLGIKNIFIKDIVYIQYIGRKLLCIKMTTGLERVSGFGITQFYEKLNDSFLFIDRDTIINLNMIIGICNDEVILKYTRNKLKISSRRLSVVKKAYFSRCKILNIC